MLEQRVTRKTVHKPVKMLQQARRG